LKEEVFSSEKEQKKRLTFCSPSCIIILLFKTLV